ncbi:MAG: hypothetical protein Q8P60_00385, partial [Pseudorhodobacter sp.]|nr:hypothetical protein [Pseudorhodobacter sp.]
VMSASVATAGGPVIVYEEPVPIVAAEPASSTGIWLPLLGLAIIVGVIASNNNNNNNTQE